MLLITLSNRWSNECLPSRASFLPLLVHCHKPMHYSTSPLAVQNQFTQADEGSKAPGSKAQIQVSPFTELGPLPFRRAENPGARAPAVPVAARCIETTCRIKAQTRRRQPPEQAVHDDAASAGSAPSSHSCRFAGAVKLTTDSQMKRQEADGRRTERRSLFHLRTAFSEEACL